MDHLDHRIEPRVDADVAAALAEIGRTEDLRFSPDGRRIALAGFAGSTVVVVDAAVAEEASASGAPAPAVVIAGVLVATTELDQPHGLDWLDDATLIVGDRAGEVWRVPVPAGGRGVRRTRVAGVRLAIDADLVRGPGSVAIARGPEGGELLVCQNWADTITRHPLGPAPTAGGGEVWLRRSLDLPDGVAVSGDGRWVAVSNHNQHVVLVYDRAQEVDPDERTPVGVLRGSLFPHGLRFSPDGDQLFVADAGSPFVHVHRAARDGWSTAGYPVAAIRVVEDDVFARGHQRPDEGGPKGIDIDPTGRVMAITTEHRPLGFVDLTRAATDPTPAAPAALAAYEQGVLDRDLIARATREEARHDALAAEVREHDARALAARTAERAQAVEAVAAAARAAADEAQRRAETAEACAAEAEDHLAAIRATILWRSAERPRRAYARLRAWRGSGRAERPRPD